MSWKRITASVTIIMTFNVCSWVTSQEQQQTEDLERAKITREKSAGLRMNRIFQLHTGYTFIRDLCYSRSYWRSALTLSDNQEVILKKLDSLLYQANLASSSHDADYLDTNPRDYNKYLERNERRRREAVLHGQLMSLSGLLTESQAKAVIQQHLSDQKWRGFQQTLIQELMDFTEAQKMLLKRAQSDYNQDARPLFMGSMLPDANQAEIQAGLQLLKDQFRSDSRAVLTPAQKKRFAQLTEKQPAPSVIPTLPAPAETDQVRLDPKKLSDVFRTMGQLQNENKLKLSKVQNQLLAELYLVTIHGLFWIEAAESSQADAEQSRSVVIPHTRTEFLKHAEQLALLGVLTERQTRQVQDAL